MCRFGWNEIILCHYLLEFWFLALSLSLGFRLSFWNDIAAARAKRNIFRAYCPSYVLNRFLTKSSCFNDRWRKKKRPAILQLFFGHVEFVVQRVGCWFFFSCVMTTSTTKPQIRNYLNGKRLRERRNGGIHVNTKPGKRPKMNRKKCHSTMQLQKTGKKTRRKNH